MTFAIYVGHSLEPFNPLSQEKGIGGSEEAVIEVARELTKLGHWVTIYGRTPSGREEVHQGVRWLPYERVRISKLPPDVLVVWRYPHLIKELIETNPMWEQAGRTALWLHDTVGDTDVLPYALMYDTIFVLSDFHKDLYRNVRELSLRSRKAVRVIKTANGIDPKHFKKKVKKVPYRMIYASSYDRGLADLLERWTEIKSKVPEATLHICYGWNTSEKLNTDKPFQSFKDHIENMMNQEGITHLGRLSHEELAREMLEAEVWAYPTWWPETFCITAIKAQAAGAIPVVIPSGSVREMVQWGWKHFYSATEQNHQEIPSVYVDIWKDALIQVLQHRDMQQSTRPHMMKWAKEKYSWANVAKQWTQHFTS